MHYSVMLKEAIDNLKKVNWKVDYIITHCAPTSVFKPIAYNYESDKLTDFFDELRERCEFRHWFFGHYHMNQDISERFTVNYDRIIKIGD